MTAVKARFIGGPLDGKVQDVEGDRLTIEVAAPNDDNGPKSVVYRRHVVSLPVGEEQVSVIFVPAHLNSDAAHRLLMDVLRPRR